MGDILPIILFAGLIILGIYVLFLPASIANEKVLAGRAFFYSRFSAGQLHSFGPFGF